MRVYNSANAVSTCPLHLSRRRQPSSGRKTPGGAHFQAFKLSSRSADATDYREAVVNPGSADTRGQGAGATVMHDSAAGGEDDRVIHRADHFDVVEFRGAAEVGRAGADQKTFTQLGACRAVSASFIGQLGSRIGRPAARYTASMTLMFSTASCDDVRTGSPRSTEPAKASSWKE